MFIKAGKLQYFLRSPFQRKVLSRLNKSRFAKEDIVSLNIAETFELLFDKNNNIAYKALQKLQKENVEADYLYPFYLFRLNLFGDNPLK